MIIIVGGEFVGVYFGVLAETILHAPVVRSTYISIWLVDSWLYNIYALRSDVSSA
jgi:hypothetical protein